MQAQGEHVNTIQKDPSEPRSSWTSITTYNMEWQPSKLAGTCVSYYSVCHFCQQPEEMSFLWEHTAEGSLIESKLKPLLLLVTRSHRLLWLSSILADWLDYWPPRTISPITERLGISKKGNDIWNICFHSCHKAMHQIHLSDLEPHSEDRIPNENWSGRLHFCIYIALKKKDEWIFSIEKK